MGWIRIKSTEKEKLMLSSSMQYIACISEGTIRILETEKLLDMVKTHGTEINRAEFDRLQKSQKRLNQKWWSAYRTTWQKSKQEKKYGNHSENTSKDNTHPQAVNV